MVKVYIYGYGDYETHYDEGEAYNEMVELEVEPYLLYTHM